MQEKTISAWISKYALTDGIYEVKATWCRDISEGMISYQRPGLYPETAHGKDWHRTREAAFARAEEMRVTRIASIKKTLRKLEALRFAQ